MAAMLRIAFLGAFQLNAGTTVVTTVNTPRLQALLAYLVLRRGVPLSRQQLAFLFWPDSSDAQARTNLRTLLHRLRTALPDADTFLNLDAQSVCWRADASFTLDVVEFETALTQAASAAQAGATDTVHSALERAMAIYQGHLLPDCYDEWVLPERERLQQLALSAFERLVEYLEHQRDYAAAIDYARRLLQLDPLRETTYLSLMRLHAAYGDRAGALRVYHACATILRDELSAEPNPAIRAAYERLLAADAPQPAPAAALTASAPLVGRGAEWARAQATWQAAASGRPRLLVLAGEAGIGKTRLAEELLAWGARQGAVTAIARCYAAEGDLAYAPVTEWLRADALRRRLARIEAIWLTEIVRLVPEMISERPDLLRPGPLTERWQRRRLFEALARAVLAGNRPLLLLIDDLQWCDSDTLEWLHFLLRYEPRARLLVVATLRTEEAGVDLAALLHDARRSDQLTEVELGPLSQAEAAALAGHMTNHPLSSSAAANLYAETEGNPLFVVERVRAGLVREMQRQVPDTDEIAEAIRLPPGIQAVISHRLNQIKPAARELLRLAAVIGRSFTFGVLARAADDDEDTLVRGLDELWQRRIVREQGADAYDFSHDKLRVVVYDGLSAARRRVLHRRVAEALEAEYATNLDAVSGQIAVHYERAGQAEPAIAYYRRAADVAQQVWANAEAIAYLRRALVLLTATTTSELPKRQPTAAVLNQRLGDLLHLSGQSVEARSAYEHALECITEDDRRARTHLHRKIGNTWRDQNHYDQAFAAYTAAEIAIGLAPHETDHKLWQIWIEIQFERIQTWYWLAEVPEMLRLIEATRPIAERYGSPLQRARLYHASGQASLRRDRNVASDETVAYAHAYLAAVEEAGAAAALPAARFQAGFMLLLHADHDAAEEHILAALDLAERTGDVSLEARCLTYLTIINRKRGQFDAVRTYAERSLRVAMAERMPDYVGAAHGNLAWLAWRSGNLAEARTHGQQALRAWRGTSLVFASQWTALWPLIGVALAENQVAEVAEYALTLLDPKQQRLPEALEAALQATVRAAGAGDLEAARDEVARALDPARALGYL